MVHYSISSRLQQPYAGLGFGVGAFPLSKAIHREVLRFPMEPQLSREQQGWVVAILREV